MPSKSLRSTLLSALPRVMHVYWRFARGLTMGVRAVVIGGDGSIFLVKHSYAEGWHLPGGGVEVGETLIEALARELAEEGNIELSRAALHGVFFHPHFSTATTSRSSSCETFRQTSAPRPTVKSSSTDFSPPDALPPDATAGTRARIAEVLSRHPPVPHW